MQYKNFRSNPKRSRNGRPTSGHCVECGRVTCEADGGIRVTTPAQRNGVWVCSAHRGKKNLRGYSEENTKYVGSGNADNISISLELESMGIATHVRAYLVSNGFLPTSDSTVDIEYKSPIYTSEQPLAKIIGGIEYFNDSPDYNFKVNAPQCGLHTHFGFIDNRYNFTGLYKDYEILFRELDDIVKNLDDDDKETIFGRGFGDYREPLSFYSPDRHENWINIQHDYSLEIRLPRFVSAVQYMKFLKTFKKMFKALDTHYISKGAQHNVNHERNAEKASRKICAIFRKAYNIEMVGAHYEIVTENTIRPEVVYDGTLTVADNNDINTLISTIVTDTGVTATLAYDSLGVAS